MKQQALYKIVGMQKDVADSAMDKQHAFDIRNMRFRHTGDNTVAALVNEEGNTPALDAQGQEIQFVGTVIGCTTLNDTGIVFTHIDAGNTSDRIYLIDLDKSVNGRFVLFEYFVGNLNFSAEHPIECTVYFENEEIQKVYWVDGINPLRYANIADKNKRGDDFVAWDNSKMFDSVPELELNEKVTITRNSSGGLFPSGTVQWCFTYLNRYGAESNIAWISPIYYSSPDDRGGKPGENCANSFTIKIQKAEHDGRFDYIRLYHIVHTTLDTEAEVRRVADIPLSNKQNEDVVYTDTNTTGETVDPNELLYLGGICVIPQTIEQKNNTLFLGNIKTEYKYLNGDVFESREDGQIIVWGNDSNNPNNRVKFFEEVSQDPVTQYVPADRFSGYYSHENQLKYNASEITTFKRGEDYRFGFQAQDKTGRWSDVWWLGDYKNTTAYAGFDNDGHFKAAHAKYTLPVRAVNRLTGCGYVKVRPVIVYPEPWERNIYTEGLINPTVYNVKDRRANAPFAQSSWFLRPFSPIDMGSINGTDSFGNVSGMPYPETPTYLTDLRYYSSNPHFPFLAIDVWHRDVDVFDFSRYGSWAEFRHNYPLGDSQQHNGEVQSMYNPRVGDLQHSGYTTTLPYLFHDGAGNVDDNDVDNFIKKFPDFFFVDQSIFTVNSADIEFDHVLQATDFGDCSLRVIGYIPIHSFISSFDIITNTPPNKFFSKGNDSMLIPQGLYGSETVGAEMKECGFGWKSLISAGLWHDDIAYHTVNNDDSYNNDAAMPVGFAVYPWQAAGSLNNDSTGSRRVYPNGSDSNESKSAVGDNYISAELKTKILANLHYSHNTCFITNLDHAIPLSGTARTVLDEQQVSLTKIASPKYSGLSDLHYFGSVDKLITPITEVATEISGTEIIPTSIKDAPFTRVGGFPKMVSSIPYCHGQYSNVNHLAFSSPYTVLSKYNTLTGYDNFSIPINNNDNKGLKIGADRSMSSIAIKYKSCNHIVFALDYDNNNGNPLQRFLGWDGKSDTKYETAAHKHPFYSINGIHGIENTKLFNSAATFDGCVQKQIASVYNGFSHRNTLTGFLYYGQLCRSSEVPNKFGGTTFEAIEQNVWLPAGDAVRLDSASDVTLVWSVGDTYYQRYDALRTYPFIEEDVNKVVDIVSFMTETHINIDGRYDKNRGLSNNNHCRPTNFNLLNMVYSQRDNFFTYHTLNPKKVNLDNFEYSFTWSLQKTAGSLRDEWTRVTLANTYDCDGNKGSLTSINRLDNNLVAFQESGVSQILYNENVQIQGSEGVPIELANSGKVTGVRYFSTEIGCQNKRTISVFPNGIYWVDGRINEFCALGSNGIEQISTAKLMSTWFKKQNDFIDEWRPSDWRGFISHRDIGTGEMFLTSKGTCLCYDTIMAEFTSLYDYNRTDAMFTIKGNTLTIADNTSGAATLWLHRGNKNNHCNFYGEQYPFSIEIVCNSNNQGNDYGLSKIFDNMSWRSDAWQWNSDDSWTYKPFVTWTDMNGKNDYQTFSLHFDDVNGNNVDDSTPQVSRPQLPLNLRKKFKVWYTTIPRSDESKTVSRPMGSDRIRDTWCHITLSADTSVSHFRHVLHDLSVTYFIP